MKSRLIVSLLLALLVTAPALALIRVGSKPFTESVILAEMVRLLLAHHRVDCKHLAELGGSQIIWKALLSSEIDAYPEYTGTLQSELLAGQGVTDDDSLKAALAKVGIGSAGKFGFSNTYALGLKKELADRLALRTISDLAKHPKTRIGLSDEFLERKDGWPGLAKKYQLPHSGVRGMNHSLALRGLVENSIDVTDLYSTDAEIQQHGLVVLEDDRAYFPRYEAVLLYRLDLQQRSPAAVEQLKRLAGAIDNATMVALNSKVQIEGKSEARAAAEFLNERFQLGIDYSRLESATPFQRRLERFLRNTWEHLFLVAISLSLAVIIAIPLGVLAYRNPTLGQVILAIVGIIQTLPSMALLVFMIPLLGLGAWPAIVALFLYSLLPIVRNTYAGLHEIPENLRESAMVLGLPDRARLMLVELPMASRSIVSGIKIAAVINVGTATIGALIGAGGYGEPILTGIRLDDVALILQGALPAAALALGVQGFFGFAERWIVPKGLRL